MNIIARQRFAISPEDAARQARDLLKIERHSISAIYAVGTNGAFSLDGGLPWKNENDMAFFRAMTLNSVVIMGRKTYESLPAKHRPLSHRVNIVVSRTLKQDGIEVEYVQADSIERALVVAHDLNLPIFIIGGASIIEEVLPRVTNVIVTTIPYDGFFEKSAPEFLGDNHNRMFTIHERDNKWKNMYIDLYVNKDL